MTMFLPQDSILDTSEFTRPQTPAATAFGDTINEALSTGPTEDIFFHTQKVFMPGNKLTNDEYKKSEYYRAAIDYPDGVGENVARTRANAYDKERERQFELSSSNQGIVSRSVSSLIGTALDPINIAAGAATAGTADYLVGVRSAAVLEKLSKLPNLAQSAARVAGGAVEGAIATTPAALAQYDVEQQLGMDPHAANILATIGMGAGFGGVIRGLTGYRLPVKPEADKLAKQTAIHQLTEGKSVNVSDIIQQGFFEQHQVENPSQVLSELENTHGGNIEAFAKSIDENIKSKSEELNNVTSLEEANRFVHGLSSEHEIGKEAPAEFNKVVEALNTSGFERNANQVFLLNNLPSGEEFKRAVQIISKPAFERLGDEKVFIDSFLRGDEKQLINERLERHENDIQKINEEIEKIKPDSKRGTKKIEVLKGQKAQLEDRVKIANERLKTIKGEPLNLTRSQSLKNDIETLSKTKNALMQLQNEMAINRAIVNKTVKPVSIEQLKSNSDRIHSYKGDSSINEEEVNNFIDELEGMADEDEEKQIAELEEDVKGLPVDEEDREELENIKDDESNFSKLSNALFKLANCLKG